MNAVPLQHRLVNTLGSADWLQQNEREIRSLFPPEGVMIDQTFFMRLGFKLKLLGADWRSNDELIKSLLFLRKAGIVDITSDGKRAFAAVKLAYA